MAKSGHYRPFGQTPYEGVRVSGNSSGEEGVLDATKEKWIVAGLFGLLGGSLAYFIYNRRMMMGNSDNVCRMNPSTRQPSMAVDTEFSCIRDLPAEIRAQIWQALPYDDRLSLRLTSKFTKDDVDAFVGLSGRITTTDTEKYDFYQRVALSSCWITELQQPIDEDFLLNPSVLQMLDIREHAPIPLQNIRAILRVTTNLKHLKLRMILSDNSKGISEIVLESLPNMKDLKYLHLRTKMHYVDPVKNYAAAASHSYSFTSPKTIKTVHLELPDLPDKEVAKWKMVLDKQISIENLIVNVGNVSWRFFEQVLGQNSGSIQRLGLEGLRGWNDQREVEDPMDWSIFAEFVQLKSIDLSCNRGGEHDELATTNFNMFPCAAIEEFYISRLTLAPEAVERVYRDMSRLLRGALDHIGHVGIERAAEMAWLINQAEEDNRSWWQDERFWEMVINSLFGISVAFVLTYVMRSKGPGVVSLIGGTANAINNTEGGRVNDDGTQN